MAEAVKETNNGVANPSLEGAALELAAMTMHGFSVTAEPTQVQRKALEVVNLVMDSRHGDTTPSAASERPVTADSWNGEEGATNATRRASKFSALADSLFSHELLEVYKQQVIDQRAIIDHMDREHITRADLKRQVDKLRELLLADQAAIEKTNGELLVSRAQATFHADKIVHLSQRISKEIASERNQIYLEQAAHVEKDAQDRMAQNDAWDQDIESKVDQRVEIAERLAVLSTKIDQLKNDTCRYEQPQNNSLVFEDEICSDASYWDGGDVDDDNLLSEDSLEDLSSCDGDENESHVSYTGNQAWGSSKTYSEYPYQAYVKDEGDHDESLHTEHEEHELSEDDAQSRASTIETEADDAAEKGSYHDWFHHNSCWDCDVNSMCCNHYKKPTNHSGWGCEKGCWTAAQYTTHVINCICGSGCTTETVRANHDDYEHHEEHSEQDQHQDNADSEKACSPDVSGCGRCDFLVDAAWGRSTGSNASERLFADQPPSDFDEECDNREYKVGDYYNGKRVLAIDAMGNLVCDHEPEKDWEATPQFFMGAELAPDFLPKAYHRYSGLVDGQMEEWYEDDEAQFTYIDGGPWRGLIIDGEHRGKYAFGLKPPTDEQIAEELGENWSQASEDEGDIAEDEPQFWPGWEPREDDGMPKGFREFAQDYEVLYAYKGEEAGLSGFTYVSNEPWRGLVIDGEHRGKYAFGCRHPSDMYISTYKFLHPPRPRFPGWGDHKYWNGRCSPGIVDQQDGSKTESDEVNETSTSPTDDNCDEDEYRRQVQEKEAEIDELKHRLQGEKVQVVTYADTLAAKEAEIQALTDELQQARAALLTMPNDRGVQTSSTFGHNSPRSTPIHTPASSQLSDDSSFDKISIVEDEPLQVVGADNSAWVNVANEHPEHPEYRGRSSWW